MAAAQSPPISNTPAPPFHYDSEGHGGGAIHSRFESITSHPHYRDASFDELRLLHYHQNGPPDPALRSCFAIGQNGLASISLARQPRMYESQRSLATDAQVYGAETVTFRVGTTPATDFVIHKDLVTFRSPFVRGALRGDWKEAKALLIPLDDDDPEVFQLYQHWVYTNKIASAHPFPDSEGEQEFKQLVRAYALGEKLMDSRFKDSIITCILDRMEDNLTFDVRLSSIVYDNTPPESLLRKLWLHVYVWCGSPDWLNEEPLGEPVHPDLLHDISKLYMTFWNGQRPALSPLSHRPCQYHEHPDGICVSQSHS